MFKATDLDAKRAEIEKQELVRTKQTSAACAKDDIDPDLFFELGKETEAKKICSTCPLVNRCFEYALTNNEYGVWGNSTEKERAELRAIMKRRKRK